MEYISNRSFSAPRIRAALFDFDGTLSTFRSGWETVMRALMLEMISGGHSPDAQLCRRVDAYIDESAGIQTIYQMKWLADEVKRAGNLPGASDDPWQYKAEYNRRLMAAVGGRREDVLSGRAARQKYIIDGSEDFLRALKERGVRMFIASGTDHTDVVAEADALGLSGYFDSIAGAPAGAEGCSKEAVLKRLVEEEGLTGDEVAVIGDGKVEIALGRDLGARTLGLATNEAVRHGVDMTKRARLVKAGADCIAGDFLERDSLLRFLGLN